MHNIKYNLIAGYMYDKAQGRKMLRMIKEIDCSHVMAFVLE